MGDHRKNEAMFPLEPQLPLEPGDPSLSPSITDRYDRYDRYDIQVKPRHVFPLLSDRNWDAFKAIVTIRGQSIRQVTQNLILNYIKANAPKTFQTVNITHITVEGDVNVFQMIFEEEVAQLCTSIRASVARDAPQVFLAELREKLWTTLKKHPHLSPPLAEEVKAAFTLLREAWT